MKITHKEKIVENLLISLIVEDNDLVDKKVLNFLRRRAEIKDVDYGDEESPFKIRTLSFNTDEGKVLMTSMMKKSDVEFKIIVMLYENGVIDHSDVISNSPNSKKQKIIRTIRLFLKENPLFEV